MFASPRTITFSSIFVFSTMELDFSNYNNSEIWSCPFLPFCKSKNQGKDAVYFSRSGLCLYKVLICLRNNSVFRGIDCSKNGFQEKKTNFASKILTKHWPKYCWNIIWRKCLMCLSSFTFALARQLRQQMLMPNIQALQMY